MNKRIVSTAIVLAILAALLAVEVRAQGQTLEQLRDAVVDGSYAEAKKAITGLADQASPQALEILVGLLRAQIDKNRKGLVINAIAGFKTAPAAAALVAGYADCDENLRKTILNKAYSLKDCGGEDIIIVGLNDKDYSTMQLEAVRASSKLRTPKIESAMLVLMNSAGQDVRIRILEYIPKTERTKTSDEILDIGLNDKEPKVVVSAIERVVALQDIDDAKKIERIKHVAFNKSTEARMAMAGAMEKINTEAALEQIVVMIRSTKDEKEIAALVGYLKGKNFPNVLGIAVELAYRNQEPICLIALDLMATLPKNKEIRDTLVSLASGGDKKKPVVMAAVEALKNYPEEEIVFVIYSVGKRSKDEDIQSKVVDVLIEMPPLYVKNLLSDMYKWAKDDSRLKVVEGLGDFKIRNAAAALVRTLEDELVDGKFKDDELADGIATALRSMGGYQAAQGLELVLAHGSDKARIQAIRGLVEYQSPQAIQAVGALLDDENLEIRCEAIYMLGAAGRSEYIAKISAALDSTKSEERLEAVRALGNIADSAAVAALISEQTQNNFSARKGDFSVLIKTVGRLGGPQAVEFLLGLAEGLNNQYALEALNALSPKNIKGNEQAVEKLLSLSKSGNEERRIPAIRALGYAGGRKAFDELLVMTIRRSLAEASAAVEAIVDTGEADAAEELNALLSSDKYRGGIDAVIAALVRLGKADPDACIAACDNARGRSQRSAIAALSRLKDPKVKARLLKEMADERPQAETVVGTIATYGDDKECRDAVIAMLRKHGPENAELIEACAGARHKDFVDALTLIMLGLDSKKQQSVLRTTRYALSCIVNRDLGDDPEAWRTWWRSVSDKSLDEIVTLGFQYYGYDVPAKITADGLFFCAGLLYKDDGLHFLRIHALHVLTAAAGETREFIPLRDWKTELADEWYCWWLVNKNMLEEKYKQ